MVISEQHPRVDAEDRREVLECAADLVESRYVLIEVGRSLAQQLRLDAAADDTELSEWHSRLREDGNWLGVKVWNRGAVQVAPGVPVTCSVDADGSCASPGCTVKNFTDAAPGVTSDRAS